MELKEGVKIGGMQPELLVGLIIAEGLCRDEGVVFVVTSLMDGRHKQGSKHYEGFAFDMRTWAIKDKEGFARKLRTRLGGAGTNLRGEWDVVVENTHIHVEFDPD